MNTCINCGNEFNAERTTAKFCSDKCRIYHSRKKLSVTKESVSVTNCYANSLSATDNCNANSPTVTESTSNQKGPYKVWITDPKKCKEDPYKVWHPDFDYEQNNNTVGNNINNKPNKK